jgi:hypothetical protein
VGGGDLAEGDLSRRVAEALDYFGHRGKLGLVPPLPGGIEGEPGGEFVEPVNIERGSSDGPPERERTGASDRS